MGRETFKILNERLASPEEGPPVKMVVNIDLRQRQIVDRLIWGLALTFGSTSSRYRLAPSALARNCWLITSGSHRVLYPHSKNQCPPRRQALITCKLSAR
jgi:hypothetical protein